ncbi:MAG: hypothetical protein MK108_02070 [Mariniblastus sp.]|nr:hypothetical protein [Mariniblastus sp.]
MHPAFQLLLLVSCLLPGCEADKPTLEAPSVLAVETTSPQEPERQAVSKFEQGNYTETIEQAQKILKQKPDSLNALMLIGEASFMKGDVHQSIESFDRMIELNPQLEPRLWQRGLALYYADRFQDGKEQFETHQTYNRQDVENAVWHLLCHSKIVGLEKAREEFIPITQDSRVPMKQIHQLFGGSGSVEDVFQAATSTPALGRSKAFQIYYAHLYVGLYYDMVGDQEKSLAEMRAAAKINPLAKDLLMGRVADVHLLIRKADEPIGQGGAGKSQTDKQEKPPADLGH